MARVLERALSARLIYATKAKPSGGYPAPLPEGSDLVPRSKHQSLHVHLSLAYPELEEILDPYITAPAKRAVPGSSTVIPMPVR